MEQQLSVLRVPFFLLLTKQLISQYFFNSLIRKSFFNLTHYQATQRLLKLLFNYSTLSHKHTCAHASFFHASLSCLTGSEFVCER